MSIHPHSVTEDQGRVALPEDDGVPADVRMRARVIGEKIVMGSLTYFYWLVGQAESGAAAMGDLNESEITRVRQRSIRLAEATCLALAVRERQPR